MVLPVTQRAGWQKEAVRGIQDRGEWGLDGGCPERARGDKLWSVKELVAASRQELIGHRQEAWRRDRIGDILE